MSLSQVCLVLLTTFFSCPLLFADPEDLFCDQFKPDDSLVWSGESTTYELLEAELIAPINSLIAPIQWIGDRDIFTFLPLLEPASKMNALKNLKVGSHFPTTDSLSLELSHTGLQFNRVIKVLDPSPKISSILKTGRSFRAQLGIFSTIASQKYISMLIPDLDAQIIFAPINRENLRAFSRVNNSLFADKTYQQLCQAIQPHLGLEFSYATLLAMAGDFDLANKMTISEKSAINDFFSVFIADQYKAQRRKGKNPDQVIKISGLKLISIFILLPLFDSPISKGCQEFVRFAYTVSSYSELLSWQVKLDHFIEKYYNDLFIELKDNFLVKQKETIIQAVTHSILYGSIKEPYAQKSLLKLLVLIHQLPNNFYWLRSS